MVAAFIAPCFVTNPHGDLWFAFVPVNDYRTVFYHVWWNAEKLIGEEPHRSKQLEFIGLDRASLESHGLTWETCDGPEQMTRANYFKKNKEAARKGHFTGMHSFTQEDAAVSISSGPIRDRSQERLSTADGAISRLYRSLLTCAKQAAEGREPLGLNGDTTQIIGAHGTLALVSTGGRSSPIIELSAPFPTPKIERPLIGPAPENAHRRARMLLLILWRRIFARELRLIAWRRHGAD